MFIGRLLLGGGAKLSPTELLGGWVKTPKSESELLGGGVQTPKSSVTPKRVTLGGVQTPKRVAWGAVGWAILAISCQKDKGFASVSSFCSYCVAISRRTSVSQPFCGVSQAFWSSKAPTSREGHAFLADPQERVTLGGD